MRTLALVLTAGVLGAGCESSFNTPLSESHSAAMRDSVRSFLSTWSVTAREGDWDRLVERYADDPDFVWVEDGQVRYTSVEEISSAVEDLNAAFTGSTTEFIKPTITPLAPGVVNVSTHFRTTLRRDSDPDIQYDGAMTMTAINSGDGWEVLQGHTSTARQRR